MRQLFVVRFVPLREGSSVCYNYDRGSIRHDVSESTKYDKPTLDEAIWTQEAYMASRSYVREIVDVGRALLEHPEDANLTARELRKRQRDLARRRLSRGASDVAEFG